MARYQEYIDEGYSNEQAFYLAEIKTTQQILEDLGKNNIYMPTLLINSLLSMIVLPYEKAKTKGSGKVFSDKFSVFEHNIGIKPTLFQPIKTCKNCKIECNKKVTSIFINRLRNGIAHQNITVSPVGDRDFSITIKNKYKNTNCNNCKNPTCKSKELKRENGGVIDFEITLTVEQLMKLAEYIANKYLHAIDKKN